MPDSNDLYQDEIEPPQHQDTIQSVCRAIRVLRAFSTRQPELGVAELSRRTGLSKTTVYRLLITLEQESFIRQSSENDKYKLGSELIRLGHIVLDSIDVAKHALPYMRGLVDRTDETVILDIWDNGRTLVLANVDGRRLSRVNARAGSHMPAHATSSGKLLLAFRSREEIDKLIRRGLKRYTENTITDQDSLLVELEEIRANGIAFDREELDIGTRGISTPIFDHRGSLAAALTIAGPTQRLNLDEDGDLARLLRKTAKNMSSDLGYAPEDH